MPHVGQSLCRGWDTTQIELQRHKRTERERESERERERARERETHKQTHTHTHTHTHKHTGKKCVPEKRARQTHKLARSVYQIYDSVILERALLHPPAHPAPLSVPLTPLHRRPSTARSTALSTAHPIYTSALVLHTPSPAHAPTTPPSSTAQFVPSTQHFVPRWYCTRPLTSRRGAPVAVARPSSTCSPRSRPRCPPPSPRPPPRPCRARAFQTAGCRCCCRCSSLTHSLQSPGPPAQPSLPPRSAGCLARRATCCSRRCAAAPRTDPGLST
eukprot:1746784-Rhodomonas_salina.4